MSKSVIVPDLYFPSTFKFISQGSAENSGKVTSPLTAKILANLLAPIPKTNLISENVSLLIVV